MTRQLRACTAALLFVGCGMLGKPTDVTTQDVRRASPELQALVPRAQAGETDAQYALGMAYANGTGVRMDAKEAERWLSRAAESGSAPAQYALGAQLQTDRRFAEAVPWLERAAAQQHAGANLLLGKVYDQGLGVMRDSYKAMQYYEAAANLKSSEAMWNISLMFDEGRLGQKNPLHACIWGMRARRFAASTDPMLVAQITRAAPYLERPLSGQERSDCQRQAETWEPRGASK